MANAVKVTIGPKGRNVVLGIPLGASGEYTAVVINDGVSIASDIDLELPEEQIGAKLLLQACSQTDSRAGDGTTTSAVLTQALCNVGAKYISNGANAVALQRGLVKSAKFFVNKIREVAMPITTIEQYRDIASISANSEEMGQIVADALMRVGADGAVTTENGNDLVDSLDFAEGLEHEVGYVNDGFVKDQETQTCTLVSPRIFVTDQKVCVEECLPAMLDHSAHTARPSPFRHPPRAPSPRVPLRANKCVRLQLTTMQDILPILEATVGSKEPLLIMALDVTNDALSGLVLNQKKGVIDVCACKTPGFGDVRTQYLEDICTFSGATFFTSELGKKPENATIADLGKCDKVGGTQPSNDGIGCVAVDVPAAHTRGPRVPPLAAMSAGGSVEEVYPICVDGRSGVCRGRREARRDPPRDHPG